MGKMLLVFIAAASVGGTLMLTQRMGTERVDNERKTLDEAQMLAREITESAYALGTSRVQSSFYERPLLGDVAYEGVAFGEGNYDLYILELPCGAMRVTATGRMTVPVADATGNTSTSTKLHSIQGDYVAMVDMPGAVLVDAAVTSAVNVEFDDTAQISGVDRRPGCENVAEESWDFCSSFSTVRPGMGGTKPQVVTNNPVLTALGASGLHDSMSSTSTVAGFPGYVQTLHDDAYDMATAASPPSYVHRFPGDEEFNGTTDFDDSSPTEPVVVLVEGDARFTGPTTGYGVMIVQGDFEAGNDFTWGGAIYVVKSGELNVRLEGDARVFGMFAVQNPDNGSGTSGPLDLQLRDEASIFYSAESISLLGDIMDSVSARSKIALINERQTPATSGFPDLECPGPSDDPEVEVEETCDCKPGKTLIEHYPRNGNMQEICISNKAVPAHVQSTGDSRHHWATTGETDKILCTG